MKGRSYQTGLLFFVMLVFHTTQAQNTIGIPNILNYSKQIYGAASQTWNMAQDQSGIIYFANNDGLVSFDGTFWRLYQLPNKTIVRSVAVSKDNRIYTGGQGEIGYFAAGKDGELEYTSLNGLVPPSENDFADVWNICFFQQQVFFRANKKILSYNGKAITVYRSDNWGYLGAVSGQLIATESNLGLVTFSRGAWLPKIKQGQFPAANVLIRSALPLQGDSILLVTLMHGLFILHQDTLVPFETPDLKTIAVKSISSATLLSGDRIALGTNLGGCIIINKQGKFIQRFTRKEGIQNNNVLAVMVDSEKNLWLGLDNGIDLVTYNNAIRNIFPDQDNRNSGYTSVYYNQDLYLGVSTGVYKVKLGKEARDISYTIGAFDFVENSQGQVWNLSAVNGQLLLGHNKGAFIIRDNKAVPLDTKTGCWGFQPLFTNQPSSIIAAGTYEGISFYHDDKGSIGNPVLYSKVEAARFVAIGKNLIWIAHPYKGVYRIQFDERGPSQSGKYPDNNNILSSNHNKVFKLGERVILTSDKGIFEYQEQQKDFVRAEWLEKLIGKEPVSYLKEDYLGNIWFCRNRRVGVLEMSSPKRRIIFIPEIDGRIMANGFENINVIDSENVLIAGEKGFFHVNYALYKKNKLAQQVLIRKVQSTLQKNGLIYGGYGKPVAEPMIQHKYNSIHFECSSNLFGQEQNTEYSYFLEGFDQEWSPWAKKTEKDYTNLPAGNYTFRVKCRNNADNESPESLFKFKILSPWYQTWWALTLYALLFFSTIYFFYKLQQRKYKRQQRARLQEQQRKYDEEQKRLQLQHQLEIQESEKQIVELRNEKLQAEVAHKNTELASSAMNLVRKREMLSKLKEGLAAYKNTPEKEKTGKELQRITKIIDKELDHNEEWEQFVVHFDSVHTNYLRQLKEYCPALTIADLKLAAYLRLNLTSKEIAQLMNISIRGVETSRYRLRKKLQISTEENLFDFLIKITS